MSSTEIKTPNKNNFFSKVFDYTHKHTPLESVAFYITHLIIFSLIIGIIAGIIGSIFFSDRDAFTTGLLIGGIGAPIISIIIGCYLVIRKKLSKRSSLFYLVPLVMGALGYFWGLAASLIIASLLLTLKNGS